MELCELVELEVELVSQRKRLISDYKKSMLDLDKDLLGVRQRKNLKAADFNLNKIKLAESIIVVRGDASGFVKNAGRRDSVVKSSVEDISINKAEKLRKQYFGTKNYSGFGDQNEDHSYGMGPRHGSIVFSVGLKESIRKREPINLTSEEKEAAIYYLLNLKKIQTEKKAVN